jgi:hypothetical protein
VSAIICLVSSRSLHQDALIEHPLSRCHKVAGGRWVTRCGRVGREEVGGGT